MSDCDCGDCVEVDTYRPWYTLLGGIDGTHVLQFQHYLMNSVYHRYEKDLHLIITSQGGDVTAGFAIVDMIRQAQYSGVRVHGHVQGFAYSMAVAILQACDTRTVGPYGSIGLHGVSAGFGGNAKELRSEQRHTQQLQKMLTELSISRANFTAKEKRKLFEDDTVTYFYADDALKRGLVDAIVGNEIAFGSPLSLTNQAA